MSCFSTVEKVDFQLLLLAAHLHHPSARMNRSMWRTTWTAIDELLDIRLELTSR
jgi:hypothetical protein